MSSSLAELAAKRHPDKVSISGGVITCKVCGDSKTTVYGLLRSGCMIESCPFQERKKRKARKGASEETKR